jgi:hypothetical protein
LPQFTTGSCSLFPQSQALHQDALAFSWNHLYAYAFPPLAIFNQVLLKIARERTKIILIVSMWTRREWYPLLLDLLIDFPYHLPAMRNLVTQDKGTLLHHNPPEVCLTAWLLSGIPSLHEAFLRRLLQPVLPQRARALKEYTSLAGTIFVPGANRAVLIPILPLWLP